jgi:FMN hydrolase / 5-amino-6-(5-phospho-D-ribitylamino)uracil phosphatase
VSQRFEGIAAISFDGDGTLWDFESSMRAALALAAESLNETGVSRAGEPVTAEWLAAVRNEVAAWPELHGAGMEVIRLLAFEEALQRMSPVRLDLAAPACERYFDDRFAVLRPYPDVADAIVALHGRFPLAVVTNGNTHPAQHDLGERFAQVVLAIECGIHKPDPAIYTLAAELLGVDPGACLHVGDHPHEDVDAARRAGMRTVWLNRGGCDWPADLPPAEAEIPNLAMLPGLL